MALVHEAIIAVLKDVKAIEKKQKNPAQHYNFRGIDDFYDEFHGLFAKHGLFVLPQIVSIQREERQNKSGGVLIWTVTETRYRFTASDGSSEEATVVGEAMDSGDKGCNKAMSAALKYLLTQTFLVPTEDLEDADKDTPPPLAPKNDDLGIGGYHDLLQSFMEVFEGKDEAEVCRILGRYEGFAAPAETARQLVVDMLKDRKVVFNKKGNAVECSGLSVEVYADISRQFGKVQQELCSEVKVA